MLAMELNHQPTRRERRERAMYLLDMVEMTAQAHKLPGAVSGGQQQRAAIARALANDPPLIVADEPTGNLDTRTANAVFDVFADLVAQGKTIVLVTHERDVRRYISRQVVLIDGRIADDVQAKAEQF